MVVTADVAHVFDLQRLASQQSRHSDAIDEIALLVDARANKPDEIFTLIRQLIAVAGEVLSSSFRKVDARVSGTPLFLRRCQDWESGTSALESDELRVVVPGIVPIFFAKGRAYVN